MFADKPCEGGFCQVHRKCNPNHVSSTTFFQYSPSWVKKGESRTGLCEICYDGAKLDESISELQQRLDEMIASNPEAIAEIPLDDPELQECLKKEQLFEKLASDLPPNADKITFSQRSALPVEYREGFALSSDASIAGSSGEGTGSSSMSRHGENSMAGHIIESSVNVGINSADGMELRGTARTTSRGEGPRLDAASNGGRKGLRMVVVVEDVEEDMAQPISNDDTNNQVQPMEIESNDTTGTPVSAASTTTSTSVSSATRIATRTKQSSTASERTNKQQRKSQPASTNTHSTSANRATSAVSQQKNQTKNQKNKSKQTTTPTSASLASSSSTTRLSSSSSLILSSTSASPSVAATATATLASSSSTSSPLSSASSSTPPVTASLGAPVGPVSTNPSPGLSKSSLNASSPSVSPLTFTHVILPAELEGASRFVGEASSREGQRPPSLAGEMRFGEPAGEISEEEKAKLIIQKKFLETMRELTELKLDWLGCQYHKVNARTMKKEFERQMRELKEGEVIVVTDFKANFNLGMCPNQTSTKWWLAHAKSASCLGISLVFALKGRYCQVNFMFLSACLNHDSSYVLDCMNFVHKHAVWKDLITPKLANYWFDNAGQFLTSSTIKSI